MRRGVDEVDRGVSGEIEILKCLTFSDGRANLLTERCARDGRNELIGYESPIAHCKCCRAFLIGLRQPRLCTLHGSGAFLFLATRGRAAISLSNSGVVLRIPVPV